MEQEQSHQLVSSFASLLAELLAVPEEQQPVVREEVVVEVVVEAMDLVMVQRLEQLRV